MIETDPRKPGASTRITQGVVADALAKTARATLAAALLPALAVGCGSDRDPAIIEVVETVGDYDPCSFDDECPIDLACFDLEIDYGDVIVSDAMCTSTCFDDFDCVSGGICLGASAGPPLCYQPCFDDFDCPINFGCVQDTSLLTFDPVCMPI